MNRDCEKFKSRVAEIDLLRAFAIILMIFDHLLNDIYDLMPYVFSDYPGNGVWRDIVRFSMQYWTSDARLVAHYVVCFFFLGITGVCGSFSRSNLARGLKLMLVAVGLSLVTYAVSIVLEMRGFLIAFGVLHCIALSLIILGLLQKFVKPDWVYLVLGLAMFVAGVIVQINSQNVSYYQSLWLLLPKMIIGTEQAGMDCFPLLLNGGQIFVGYYLGKKFYKDKKSLLGLTYKNNALTFIGRNSLFIYFAHQIVLPLVLGIILLACGFTLGL